MSIEEKFKKMLEENSDVWKSEAALMSWIRSKVRSGWLNHPAKLKLIKKHKKQIDNPNYGKPRNTKKTVAGAECSICKKDYPMKEIQIDHLTDVGHSLRKLSDLQSFFEGIMIVTQDDLRVVCKTCHEIVSHSQKKGISFEQAKVEKEFIQIKKDKLTLDKLLEYSVDLSNIPKTKKAQEELLYNIMMEKFNNDAK